MTDRYEPLNFLGVDVRQAGTDMIEAVGIATGYDYANLPVPTGIINDMEKAAKKALRAITSYRDATKKKIDRLSREEYEGLSR